MPRPIRPSTAQWEPPTLAFTQTCSAFAIMPNFGLYTIKSTNFYSSRVEAPPSRGRGSGFHSLYYPCACTVVQHVLWVGFNSSTFKRHLVWCIGSISQIRRGRTGFESLHQLFLNDRDMSCLNCTVLTYMVVTLITTAAAHSTFCMVPGKRQYTFIIVSSTFCYWKLVCLRELLLTHFEVA